jgi:hypothetical protein
VNQREMLDCFDLVFLLSLDDRTQIDRLDTASNAHRNEAQRAQIIRGRPVFEQEMGRPERWSSTAGSRPPASWTASCARSVLRPACSRRATPLR